MTSSHSADCDGYGAMHSPSARRDNATGLYTPRCFCGDDLERSGRDPLGLTRGEDTAISVARHRMRELGHPIGQEPCDGSCVATAETS